MTVSELENLVGEFIVHCKVKNLSARTIGDYHDRLKLLIRFLKQFGNEHTVSEKDLTDYIERRLNEVTPQTVNSDIRAIKVFFSWLNKVGLCDDKIALNLSQLKEPQHYPRTLSDEQTIALLNTIAVSDESFTVLRDLALIVLMLDTGVRVSEALNMTFDDVDLVQGFIKVTGKGNRERVIPIGEGARMTLHRYILKRKSISYAGDWLFITSLGTKLTKRQFLDRLKYWGKKAGISGVRLSPHTLRFTFVRKWLQSGGDSLILQRILGHTSPAMTSYYARLFADDLKEVHKRHSPIDTYMPLLKIKRKRIK